ncbi:FecR family protein [Dyadobacter sp. 32]|uniref:FecR domain-containing protein n=1 Tax=Dyadobacter sp. 32 TaxID=538966 RepID=UPI0011EBD0D7
MTTQEIQALLLRYRDGQCTDIESAQIHQWYETLNQESRLSLDDDERMQLENRLLKNIKTGMQETDEDVQVVPLKKWWRSSAFYAGIAASLILAIGFVLVRNEPRLASLAGLEPTLIQSSSEDMTEVKNVTDKEMRVTLEDKSVIILSPGSKIVFPEKFSKTTREVQLTGDAFFEITKDPSKPFCVYSGKLITKVLGTSFRIKSKTDDRQMEVEVITGKVSVFENRALYNPQERAEEDGNNGNGVVLTPNQKATYFVESGHLITSLVDIPVVIHSAVTAASERLVFSNTFLPDIIAGLQQEYGIEIVLSNENMEKCTFTGDLSDLPLYEKLDLICKSNASTFEIKGTRILIIGSGCDDVHE